MTEKIRRKQIYKCKKLGLETAEKWFEKEYRELQLELSRLMYDAAFKIAWKEWYGEEFEC